MEMDKDQKLNDLFAQARTEKPQVSFEEIKDSFSAQVENPSVQNSMTETSNLFTIKTWTIMITAILTTGISLFYLTSFFNSPNEVIKKQNAKPLNSFLELSSKQLAKLGVIEADFEVFRLEDQAYRPKFSQRELAETVKIPDVVDPKELNVVKAIFKDSAKKMEEYRFPMLTADEKKMYWKKKSQMIKQTMKRDKRMYAYIPSGTYYFEKDSVGVNPFHMQITEVTNFQYRTFLFDLLEQGRRSDFLEAKPDQSLWSNGTEFNAPMVALYFSHPAYNEYPINNISRKGAELYCVWLTDEVNKVLASKKKPLLNDVRLPSDREWSYAAAGGLKNTYYPWGGPYARNSKGCYLANFFPEEGINDDGGFHTVKGTSYAPNDFGLYCMSGNVAEMVNYQENNQPGTAGGSFLSTLSDIQLNSPDKFMGIVNPNVNIGFRVVISYGIVGVKGN